MIVVFILDYEKCLFRLVRQVRPKINSVKKKGREKFSSVNFFLAVFFRVTHDGLCERGTTCSLLFLSSTEKKACPLYFLFQRASLRRSQHFFNRLQLKPCIYPDSLTNQKLPFPITLESLTTKVDPSETQPKISIGKFPCNQFRVIINLGRRGLVDKVDGYHRFKC